MSNYVGILLDSDDKFFLRMSRSQILRDVKHALNSPHLEFFLIWNTALIATVDAATVCLESVMPLLNLALMLALWIKEKMPSSFLISYWHRVQGLNQNI